MTPAGAPAGAPADLERLAALVRAAPGRLVLPDRPRAAAVTVPAPLRLLDALSLGADRAVAVIADAAGGRWTVPLITGPLITEPLITGPESTGGGLRRAQPGDGVAAALATALGSLAAAPAGGFSAAVWHCQPVTGEQAVTVDQTNESVIAGGAAVVKWAVRLPAAGEPEQPAASRLAALGEAGFPDTPRPWGVLRWRGAGAGAGAALATVTAYLPGACDGWDWAVADVTALARGKATPAAALRPAAELGRLTAGLHATLAAAGTGSATAQDTQRWRERALADLAEAVAAGGPESERLAQRAGALRAAFARLPEAAGTPLIDVHGDLHVGQVLRAPAPGGGHTYAVTDFDGNPVLPPAERLLRAPAALDVAGMLASLDHVGRIVVHRGEGAAGPVHDWIRAAHRGFLAAYRSGLAAAGRPGLLDGRLLWPLRLHQEVREHLYAIRHLPHWRYVPDAALADLLPGPDAAPDAAPAEVG